MDDGTFPARLTAGESILWSGQPGQGVRLTARDWFIIPFSLMFCGFAVFWESVVIYSNAPIFFRFWGVPFLLVGLYMTIGRFAVDAWLRRNMHYAVTNRRILIARAGPFPRLTSLDLDRLPQMQLNERPDSSGTIRFGPQPPYWSGAGGFAASTPSLDPTPQFMAIEDAARVFDLIQRAGRGER